MQYSEIRNKEITVWAKNVGDLSGNINRNKVEWPFFVAGILVNFLGFPVIIILDVDDKYVLVKVSGVVFRNTTILDYIKEASSSVAGYKKRNGNNIFF